ncbi:MAG: dihydrodipicolinate synthase family protein [Nitriliruptoraceae bacterium]|nr:dihydrodipicolinate synthase family protein [Nitriliruptoraceae bacterium]
MTTTDRLHGIMGACLTPFDAMGGVDLDALGAQIDLLVEDCDAVALGAVEAAEYHVLDDGARAALLRESIARVDGRIPVLAGASAATPDGCLRWIELAADAGADLAYVLMPTTPWGGQPSRGALVTFFTEVTERSPLPVVAYHNPSNGADPDIATLVELSRLDGIVGFKESSRDITKISRLIHEVDLPGHASYFTTMQPMLITLMLGGAGATMPPPGTRIAAKVRDAHAAGDLDAAVAWQRLFAYFPGVWGRHGLAPVMKAALGHLGIDIGGPARPFDAVPDDVRAQLGRFLDGCGLAQGVPADPATLRTLVP